MHTRSKKSSHRDAKTKDSLKKQVKDKQNLNQNVMQNLEEIKNEKSKKINQQKKMIDENKNSQMENDETEKIQIFQQEEKVERHQQQQKSTPIKYHNSNSASKSKVQKIQQLPNQQSHQHQELQNEQAYEYNSDQSWDQQQLRLTAQQIKQQFNDAFYRHSAISTSTSQDNKYRTIKGIIYYKLFEIEIQKTYQINYFKQHKQQIEANIGCKITKIKRNVEKHFINGQFSIQNNFWILNKRYLNALSRQHGEKYMKQLQQILYFTKISPVKSIQVGNNKFFTLPILSRIDFSNLLQIVVSGKIDSIEPLAWIQCHNLRRLVIVNTNATSYKALNKINFPFIKLLQISYNKIPQIHFDRIHTNQRTFLKTFQIHKTNQNPQQRVLREIVRKSNLQLYNQDFSFLTKAQNFSQDILGIGYRQVFGYHRITQSKILQAINPYIIYTFKSQQVFQE